MFTKKPEVIISFVLDETGSMDSIRDATIEGFNSYIKQVRKDTEGNITVTLTKFNSNKVEVVYSDVPIDEVPKLNRENYNPAAVTPLYDAVGATIKKVEESIKTRTRKPAVIFVVMTDGMENDSKEYKQEDIFKMIEEKKKESWTFAFLGANQDSWATSAGLGMGAYAAMDVTATPEGMSDAFTGVAAATRNFVASGFDIDKDGNTVSMKKEGLFDSDKKTDK